MESPLNYFTAGVDDDDDDDDDDCNKIHSKMEDLSIILHRKKIPELQTRV